MRQRGWTFWRTGCIAALLFAAAAGLSVRVVHAGSPSRVALVIGNNIGNDPSRALKYAEDEVVRLAGVLKSAGDFESIKILRGSDRLAVEEALVEVRTQIETARAAGRSTLFFLYYSGHGDNEALELGASRLPLRDLRQFLETSPADVKLAFVDACQSGALAGVKGGRRGPAYEVRLSDPGQAKGLAIVTSSSANELSQESDDLRGSFFSQNVMVGLRGAADASGDGQVSLQELYQYTYRRTLAHTADSMVGGQHPTFVFKLQGAGDVILTRSKPNDAQLRFPRESGVTYTILRGGEVTGELSTAANEDMYLALPAGDYRVVRRALSQVSDRDFRLIAGSSVTVEPESMAAVAMSSTQRKKGGREYRPNQLGADVGLRSGVEPGAPSAVAGAGLAYTRHFDSVALRLRADLSKFSGTERGSDLVFDYFRTTVAADLLFPLWEGSRATFLFGPSVGIPVVSQRVDVPGGRSSLSLGVGYGLVASAAAQVMGQTWLVLNLWGGGESFLLNETETATRGTAGASLGAAFSF